MKKLLCIAMLLISVLGCNKSTKVDLREKAINLIEKEYPIKGGRNIEYSKLDTLEASFYGYHILRLFMDENDKPRIEHFHMNYNQSKINLVEDEELSMDMYKYIISDKKAFFEEEHISPAWDNVSIQPSIEVADSIRIADSIVCAEIAAMQQLNN